MEHIVRDTALSTVLFETLNQGFGNVGRMLGGKHHNTSSCSPHKSVLMQKQPWLKDIFLSTDHIPWQSSKQVLNCFSGWGPYSQATEHPTAKAIKNSMFICSLILKSQLREKSLPQSTCTCVQFLWVGWHYTMCWLKLIASEDGLGPQRVWVPVNTVR